MTALQVAEAARGLLSAMYVDEALWPGIAQVHNELLARVAWTMKRVGTGSHQDTEPNAGQDAKCAADFAANAAEVHAALSILLAPISQDDLQACGAVSDAAGAQRYFARVMRNAPDSCKQPEQLAAVVGCVTHCQGACDDQCAGNVSMHTLAACERDQLPQAQPAQGWRVQDGRWFVGRYDDNDSQVTGQQLCAFARAHLSAQSNRCKCRQALVGALASAVENEGALAGTELASKQVSTHDAKA